MENSNKIMELLGLFALFVALFLLISLLSYNPADPPAGTSRQFHNLGGEVGAYLAYYLQIGLGYTAWLVVLLLGVFSLQTFRRSPRLFRRLSLLGWLLFFAGAASLISLYRPPSGGLLGLYLVDNFRPLIGRAEALLFFSFLLIFGLSLHTARTISESLKDFWKYVRETFLFLFNYIAKLPALVEDLYPGGLFKSEKKSNSSASSSRPLDFKSKPTEKSGPKEKNGNESSSEKKSEEQEKNDYPDENKVVSLEKQQGLEEKDESEEEQENNEKKELEQSDQSPPEKEENPDPVKVDNPRPAVDEADMSSYSLPPLDLLEEGNIEETIPDEETLDRVSSKLEKTFEEFDIDARVVDANPGPVLTMYEVEPGPGVSVNKIQSRADDIKLSLAVKSVRIVSPIPGKSAVGIEVPNPNRALVKLRDVLQTDAFTDDSANLPLGIGLDVFGDPMVVDLNSLPHLLVAGATGSGKSVCINSIICSLLFRLPPDELKFIMIDPKRVELNLYEGLPHLMVEVIDDPSDANKALKWAVDEMEKRYEELSNAGCRDIAGYNEKVDESDKMPYLVVIVDELADLMFTNPKECEQSITRLAQMARAVGIHMVLATQRPSTDVITGLIKANMPARISFRVSSGTDSRVVIDQNGAETLLGNGDLLYLSASAPQPQRAQGSFLADDETKDLIRFVKKQLRPSYIDEDSIFGSSTTPGQLEDFEEEYYEDAKKLVVQSGKASASMIQRRFRVGYNRAARMIDMMEDEGIVGPHRGSKAREVIVDKEEVLDDLPEGD
ncbi:MAG: DNA translocase FtsK [bacterium]